MKAYAKSYREQRFLISFTIPPFMPVSILIIGICALSVNNPPLNSRLTQFLKANLPALQRLPSPEKAFLRMKKTSQEGQQSTLVTKDPQAHTTEPELDN